MPPSELQQIPVVQEVQGVKEAFHVAYYHTTRMGYQERVSKYLRDFVNGEEPQTSRWISLAVPLIKNVSSFDVIIRALLSSETAPTRYTPLDRLCQALAEVSGSTYSPERLEKARATADFQTLGGKTHRRRELDGVFRFDATGLAPKARVMIVDAVMTTGATIEAIAAAVRQSLPNAEVLCFVLGKADGKSVNSHLNPDYFTGATPHAGVVVPVTRPPGRNGSGPSGSSKKPRTDRLPAARNQKVLPAPRERIKEIAVQKKAIERARPAGGKKTLRSFFLVLTAIFLILGALVPLRSGRKNVTRPETLPVANAVTTSLETAAEDGDDGDVPPPPKPVVDNYPKGVVTVPGVGLRVHHSIEAKRISRGGLKNGETVSILGRHAPPVGPRWLQIKTRSGKVGWVFASVVKQRRRG